MRYWDGSCNRRNGYFNIKMLILCKDVSKTIVKVIKKHIIKVTNIFLGGAP
jgi:hypothetical protein